MSLKVLYIKYITALLIVGFGNCTVGNDKAPAQPIKKSLSTLELEKIGREAMSCMEVRFPGLSRSAVGSTPLPTSPAPRPYSPHWCCGARNCF